VIGLRPELELRIFETELARLKKRRDKLNYEIFFNPYPELHEIEFRIRGVIEAAKGSMNDSQEISSLLAERQRLKRLVDRHMSRSTERLVQLDLDMGHIRNRIYCLQLRLNRNTKGGEKQNEV
jgi:hypothetical protein